MCVRDRAGTIRVDHGPLKGRARPRRLQSRDHQNERRVDEEQHEAHPNEAHSTEVPHRERAKIPEPRPYQVIGENQHDRDGAKDIEVAFRQHGPTG